MRRDMELCRKILLAVEEQYVDVALFNLQIEDYSIEELAYHCKLLYEAGLIADCKMKYADGHVWTFGVGSLTWEGHDFLDKIREDTVWSKTKETIKSKGLPMILDVIKIIASEIITSMTAAAISGMI